MKKLKLGTKIILGFCFAIVMMTVVGGISNYSGQRAADGFNDLLNGEVAILMHAGKAEEAMLQCRRDEKDFLLKKKDKYPPRLRKHAQILKDEAAAARDLAEKTGHDDLAAMAAKIIDLADIYRSNFDTLVEAKTRAGLHPDSGFRGAFNKVAKELRAVLREHAIDDIFTAYTILRRDEKEFYRLNSVDNRDQMTASLKALNEQVAASSCNPEAKKKFQAALEAYNKAVPKFVIADNKLIRAMKYRRMLKASREMEAAIASVRVPGALAAANAIWEGERRYLAGKDPADVDLVHQALEQLGKRFRDAGILPQYVKRVTALLEEYRKNFDALVKEEGVVAEKVKIVHDTAHEIEPLAQKIYQQASMLTTRQSAEISATARRLSHLVQGLAVVIVVVTLVIALLLTRSITVPIQKVIDLLTTNSEQVAATANQVASTSNTMADGASEQAAAIEETSATMEEMTSMTRQNSDHALEADSLMRDALVVIKNADEAMDRISESMGEIAAAGQETSKIVKTIDEIAFQTNLLALNAAVEAARAGEAGAGFAVVADEVRNLAMRAAEAARTTAALIEDTVTKVESGKKIVDSANESFVEVTKSSTAIGSIVSEIASASEEQAKGLVQVNEAVVQMDNITQQNAAMAEESSAAAQEMSKLAGEMRQVVETLRSMVEGGSKAAAAETAATAAAPAAAPSLPPPASGREPNDGNEEFEDF